MATVVASAHEPVLLEQVLQGLAIRPEGIYVDGTYGRGGHARAVLDQLGTKGTLVVIDRDPQAIEDARQSLGADARVHIHHATFDRLADFVGVATADGILLDLGVSSPQLDDAARGFSFMRDGPLDMRMDPSTGISAAEFVNTAAESEIADVIATYGEERFAKRIAAAIIAERVTSPITTTLVLARIVSAAIPARTREPGKNPATRTFQALRMYVNRELEFLDSALEAALSLLRVGGRLAVISFHSLEDRPVKRFMRAHSQEDPVWRGLPNAPLASQPMMRLVGKSQATEDEVAANPRARSAILRIAERVRA
jgi:16S rRNA (cytosine1402-N4)-methyltransferase